MTMKTMMNNHKLEEKLIQTPPNTPNEGQVIVMAGSAGSGKNFAIDNFTDIGNKFKILDIDEIQKLVLKSTIIFKRFRKFLEKIDSPYANYSDQDLKDSSMFKDSEFVDTIYDFMTLNKIPQTRLGVFLKTQKNKDRLPNIVLNTTFGNIDNIKNKIDVLLDNGYKKENIHLLWVLTTKEESMARNASRERSVKGDYLNQNYASTVSNMKKFISKDAGILNSYIDGNFWVVINTSLLTQYYDDGKTVKDFKYLTLKNDKGWNKEAIESLNHWFSKT